MWLKLCLLAIFNNFGGQSTRWKWRWPARLFYRGKEISVKNNILNDDIFSKGQKKYYMVIMLVTMRVMASKSYINEPTVYAEIYVASVDWIYSIFYFFVDHIKFIEITLIKWLNIGWNYTNSLNDIEVFDRAWNFETDIWWIFRCDQKRLSKNLKRISMRRELFSRSDRKEVIVWCHTPTLLILHIDFGTSNFYHTSFWMKYKGILKICKM